MSLKKQWLWLWYGGRYVVRQKVNSLCGKKIHSHYTKRFFAPAAASDYLAARIREGKPFMAARIGFNEMSMMKAYDFGKRDKFPIVMKNMCDAAGFFPPDFGLGDRFLELMKESLAQTDFLALMDSPFEDYYVNHYMKKGSVTAPFEVMNFWSFPHSWTEALRGKKVLVVNPFTDTIGKQYQKREKLFIGKRFLPEFELVLYRSIQTAGGETCDRFADWFEALESMENEIKRLDFDIALVGCGAYGFPLSASIRRMGKQVIHMGGVLQILFGIKGNRWMKKSSTVKPYMNDAWVWPSDKETPRDVNLIEGGPYFKNGNYFELDRGKAD